jgi:hypothetical protein
LEDALAQAEQQLASVSADSQLYRAITAEQSPTEPQEGSIAGVLCPSCSVHMGKHAGVYCEGCEVVGRMACVSLLHAVRTEFSLTADLQALAGTGSGAAGLSTQPASAGPIETKQLEALQSQVCSMPPQAGTHSHACCLMRRGGQSSAYSQPLRQARPHVAGGSKRTTRFYSLQVAQLKASRDKLLVELEKQFLEVDRLGVESSALSQA